MSASEGSSCAMKKIAVIGAGFLGMKIAGELAFQGCTVHVYDSNPIAVQRVHTVIEGQLQELRDNKLLPRHATLSGSVIAHSLLSQAVARADIVFEAILEDPDIKNALFRDIATICGPETILCSNTLTLRLEEVFDDIPFPERTLRVRYLLPVYLIDSVEVSMWRETSSETVEKVHGFLKSINKKVIERGLGVAPPKKFTVEEGFEKQKQCSIDNGYYVKE